MRKIIPGLLLCFIVFFACNDGKKETDVTTPNTAAVKDSSDFDESDVMRESLADFDSVKCTSIPDSPAASKMLNKPIDTCVAVYMMKAYQKFMRTIKLPPSHITQSVGFASPELQAWMASKKEADEFRVAFGLNTEKVCNYFSYERATHLNRITVLIWAYKGGKPLRIKLKKTGDSEPIDEPFNMGNIKP